MNVLITCAGKSERFKQKGIQTPKFLLSLNETTIISKILETYDDKDSIILSVSEEDEVSIKDIATLIAKEFKYEHMMEFDDSFSDGQYKKTADNSKLMSLYGDFEFTSMNEGMKKSVQWFIEHFEECRK